MFPGFNALHVKKNEVSELLPYPMYKLRETLEAVSKTQQNPDKFKKISHWNSLKTEGSASIIMFCASAQSGNILKQSIRVSRKN